MKQSKEIQRKTSETLHQNEGVYYNNAFSLVMKHKSIRMLLAMVVKLNLELEKMNVKTAFLKRDLKETIYMKQVEGFDEKDKKQLFVS